jgi:hypothetical protein
MNKPRLTRPPYTRPRRLAGLSGVPTVPTWATAPINPANWTPPAMMPAPMPAPNHRGMTEESARCVVEELRPLNFTRSENVLFALIAGGVVGYFIGKGNR